MAIHPEMLEQARRFHQAGKLAEAERAYQQILQANGHDAEVYRLPMSPSPNKTLPKRR